MPADKEFIISSELRALLFRLKVRPHRDRRGTYDNPFWLRRRDKLLLWWCGSQGFFCCSHRRLFWLLSFLLFTSVIDGAASTSPALTGPKLFSSAALRAPIITEGTVTVGPTPTKPLVSNSDPIFSSMYWSGDEGGLSRATSGVLPNGPSNCSCQFSLMSLRSGNSRRVETTSSISIWEWKAWRLEKNFRAHWFWMALGALVLLLLLGKRPLNIRTKRDHILSKANGLKPFSRSPPLQ